VFELTPEFARLLKILCQEEKVSNHILGFRKTDPLVSVTLVSVAESGKLTNTKANGLIGSEEETLKLIQNVYT
jgi:hypothetical protein